MLDRVRRDLVFQVGEVLRTYAELYGVEPDSTGRVRYQATYEVAEADAEGRVARQDTIRAVARFTFARDQAPAAGPVREWLDITPATLPRGRYLLRLETRELATGRRIGRSQLGFVVR
jgi:hypothetical protein